MRAWPERLLLLIRRQTTLVVFGGSLLGAIAIFAGMEITDLTRHCLPSCYVDVNIYPWSYRWMLEAVRTGQNPLHTPLIGAPGGVGLTWVTAVIGPAFFAMPLTAALGAYPAVAISKLLAVALSTTAAYVLCREVVQRRGPAAIGGLLFGFGSYTTVRIMHLNLLVVFPIPLLVVQALRFERGQISPGQYVVRSAALLGFQFFVSTEIFASAVFFGCLALALLGWSRLRAGDRTSIRPLMRSSALAGLLTGLLLIPFLLVALRDRPPSIAFPLEQRSAVVTDLVIPSELHLLGAPFAAVRHDLGYIDRSAVRPTRTSREAYLGPILLVLLIRSRRSLRRISFPLLAFLAAVALLSLGPVMRVTPGGFGVPGPGWLFERIPFVGLAFPNRFPLYLWLGLAVFVAMALVDAPRWSRPKSLFVGCLCAVSLAPGPLAAAPLAEITPLDSPPALAEGTARWFLDPADTVLARGYTQQSLRWQVDSGMGFRLSDGFLGPYTPWIQTMPLSPTIVPERAELEATLAQGNVRWVMFAGSEPLPWARLLASLTRWPAIRTGGLVLWDVSSVSGASPARQPPSLEAQAALRRARDFESEGLFTQAAGMYRQVLKLRPRNRWAHFGLGAIYQHYGDEMRAALHYQAAIAENPRYVAALISIARLWRSEGFEAGAFVAFDRVMVLRPDLLTADERLLVTEGPGAN